MVSADARSRVRVAGIPIIIDPSWFIIAVLLAWSLGRGHFPSVLPGWPGWAHLALGAAAAVALFGCVLLHELGHALVARLHGLPVDSITLFIFGGVAHIAGESHRPGAELRIALAGPAVSGALAAGCGWLAPRAGSAAATALLDDLGWINLAVLVFNLLPGFPLDGGRVLRAALWAGLRSYARATRIAGAFGIALGFALMAFGVYALLKGAWTSGVWYLLLGSFLRDAARASRLQVMGHR